MAVCESIAATTGSERAAIRRPSLRSIANLIGAPLVPEGTTRFKARGEVDNGKRRFYGTGMRTFLCAMATGALALCAIGCKPDYPSCRNDDDCRTDPKEYCVDGKCQQCRSDNDCAQDEECRGGHCVSGRPKASTGASCTLDPIYFDFNESSVTTEGAATLQRDAECIKKENKNVQLVGHTDPRGTEEY